MNEAPEDCDWVAARFACSAFAVFGSLSKLAEAAVVSRTAQLTETERNQGLIPFFKRENGDDYFVVGCDRTGRIVRFYRRYDVIEISGESGHRNEKPFEFVVTVALNEIGRCRLKVDGTGEFTAWQVLRRAIESVLFQPIQ